MVDINVDVFAECHYDCVPFPMVNIVHAMLFKDKIALSNTLLIIISMPNQEFSEGVYQFWFRLS